MIKYRGLFLEYPAIPPGYEEAEYSSWEKEDYLKAIDWCKENGINTLIFMNFGFTDPEKYPYMVDKDVPANFFFKDICSYGKKNNLHIFGGIRLDLSYHFTNENPDCRAEYQNPTYPFASACWCLSKKKVRKFLKETTEYFLQNYPIEGMVFHSSEAPHCQCQECSKVKLWEKNIEVMRELKDIVDKKGKETVFVVSSWRGFDEHIKEIVEELPGVIISPWEYADPGNPSLFLPVFTPYWLEKRVETFKRYAERVWFTIPCGNHYMMDLVYPLPEVIEMWERVLEEKKVEGMMGFCGRWSSSYLNRLFIGKGGKGWEKIIKKFGEERIFLHHLLHLPYYLWYALPKNFLRGSQLSEVLHLSQITKLETLMEKITVLQKEMEKIHGKPLSPEIEPLLKGAMVHTHLWKGIYYYKKGEKEKGKEYFRKIPSSYSRLWKQLQEIV